MMCAIVAIIVDLMTSEMFYKVFAVFAFLFKLFLYLFGCSLSIDEAFKETKYPQQTNHLYESLKVAIGRLAAMTKDDGAKSALAEVAITDPNTPIPSLTSSSSSTKSAKNCLQILRQYQWRL